MKRINYKGRCEKRKASKCTEVCRTYSKIQSAYVDVLEQDESIISFECNVLLEDVEGNQYSSDFVAKKTDGSTIIRECVWRFNLILYDTEYSSGLYGFEENSAGTDHFQKALETHPLFASAIHNPSFQTLFLDVLRLISMLRFRSGKWTSIKV